MGKVKENLYVEIPNKQITFEKQLYELKVDKETNVRDPINKFNKYITQLLRVEIKINE